MSIYSITHKDKSDSELRAIVEKNTTIIMGITSGKPSASEIARGQMLLEEAEACNEILCNRKRAKEKQEEGQKYLKEHESERIDKAVLNLKHAVTPNGQLIAAILEDEDGKSMEELNGWCEELSELDYPEMKELLDGLTTEEIIEEREGKYYLRNICKPDLSLLPEDCINFLLGCDDDGESKKAFYDFYEKIGCFNIAEMPFLLRCVKSNGYVTEEQIRNEINFYMSLKESDNDAYNLLMGKDKELTESLYAINKRSSSLSRILDGNKMLKRLYHDNNKYYAIKLLGE